MVKKIVKPVAGMVVGFALCFSSTVAVAANVPTASATYASASISPFVALSAFGTMQSRSAVCAAAAGSAGYAAAAEGQPSAQGCVLPVLDQPAPVAVDTVAPMVAPVVFAPAASGFRFGIGALIAGLVLVAGLAAVFASGNNNNGRLPISPA